MASMNANDATFGFNAATKAGDIVFVTAEKALLAAPVCSSIPTV